MSGNNVLRVTQMNAIFLDNEIHKTLSNLLKEATKHLPASVSLYEQELNLLVRLVLINYSVIKSEQTFGQKLLSLKYDNLTNSKKILYIIFNTLDYIKDRIEWYKPSKETQSKIFNIMFVLKLLEFLNTTIFLCSGNKPLLIERFLNIHHKFTTKQSQRQFHSKYLTRELLWNGFIEIIIYIVPLMNIFKIKRILKDINPFQKKINYSTVPTRKIDVTTKCAHCYECPVIPYHMGCPHVFCYVCLKGNQIADSKYQCPICNHKNPNVLCDKVTC